VAGIVDFLFTVYTWVIIGRAVVSWVSVDPHNPIVRFLYEVTEPLLSRVRRLIPFNTGGIDLSPVILILAIMFLQSFLVPTLRHLAQSFG